VFQIRNEFYADTQGALLVYDVTNRSSFDALDSWLDEMKHDIGSSADFDNVIFIVCANKVSLSLSRIMRCLMVLVSKYELSVQVKLTRVGCSGSLVEAQTVVIQLQLKNLVKIVKYLECLAKVCSSIANVVRGC